jgi:hypothetical protein
MQDLDEIWFEILIRICFKSEADTWHVLISRYRFGRITISGRRILVRSDGLDCTVPIHLSGSIWRIRSKSDGREESGREPHRLGFPAGRRRRGLVQALNDGDVLAASGIDEWVDELQHGEGSPIVCSTRSVEFGTVAEERLEELRAEVDFR